MSRESQHNVSDGTSELALTFSSEDEIARLVTVAGDLEFLRSLPTDRLLTHTEVRLAAGVLRRLLIENQLKTLARNATDPQKVELVVEAVDIDSALEGWHPEWVQFAFAGGAAASQANHAGLIVGRIPGDVLAEYSSPEACLQANQLQFEGQLRSFTLDQFLQATSVAVQTSELGLVAISRRTVIQYMANRKGGVHFDPTRSLSLPKLKKKRREAHFIIMDFSLLRMGHLSGPEYELASMVTAIAEAPWSSEIVQIAQDAAPDDFGGNPNEAKIWTGSVEADGTGWATFPFSPAPGGPPGTPK